MSEIEYEVEEDGNTYILRMKGVITAQTLPEYRKIVTNLMEEKIHIYGSEEEAKAALN